MIPRAKMHCTTARSLASEAVDGRLGQTDALRFRAHLLACQSCRKLFDDLRRVRTATRQLPRQPAAADFKQRLLARIRAGEGSPPAILRTPVPFAHRVKLFASGAATAAALLLSAWLVLDGLRGKTEEPAPESGPVAARRSSKPSTAELDPLWLTRRAVDTGVATFNTLRRQAPTYLDKPYKYAVPKLLDQSEAALSGFDLVSGLNGRSLDLPDRVARRIAEVRSVLAEVLRVRLEPRYGPDDLPRIVALIRKPEPFSAKETEAIRLRNVRRLDLKGVFPGITPDAREWSRLFDFLERHVLRHVKENTLILGDGLMLGNRTIQFRIEPDAHGQINLYLGR